MKRRTPPMERLQVTDAAAKAKVALVLEVLSGEKPISQACRETGVNMLAYYKLEERMLRAMLAVAQMPPGRRSTRNPAAEASFLAAETEDLRQEHRRIRSLLRVSRKLLAFGQARARKGGPGRPKGSGKKALAQGMVEPPRRPGRPPQHPPAPAEEIRKES